MPEDHNSKELRQIMSSSMMIKTYIQESMQMVDHQLLTIIMEDYKIFAIERQLMLEELKNDNINMIKLS